MYRGFEPVRLAVPTGIQGSLCGEDSILKTVVRPARPAVGELDGDEPSSDIGAACCIRSMLFTAWDWLACSICCCPASPNWCPLTIPPAGEGFSQR